MTSLQFNSQCRQYSPVTIDEAFKCCVLWQVLVPPLKDLECYIFENINTTLWSNVLVETAMSEAFASVAQSANHSPHHPRISQQELAIHRWHDALAVRSPAACHLYRIQQSSFVCMHC